MCALRDTGRSIRMRGCSFSQDFSRLEGRNKITVEQGGVYKVMLGGDVVVGENNEVTLNLDMVRVFLIS